MDTTLFATKGNLIQAKNTLSMSRMGYELMDKKRNILIRELMDLIDRAKDIQGEIDQTFREAYAALQSANVAMGISGVEKMGLCVPIEENVSVLSRSVMGVEIPVVSAPPSGEVPPFALGDTTYSLDVAYQKFAKVKELTLKLASVENAAYRLATSIKKTQKRANALKNIMIPKYEEITKTISAALEEKEREEFTRLKVIKAEKEKKENG